MASETETPVPTCPPPPETLERGGQCRKVSSKMMPRSGEGDGERVAKIGGGGVRRTEPSAPTVDVSGPAENGGSVGVRGAVVCSGGAGTSVTLEEILKTFNAPISEDQAWALIFQASRMFKARLQESGCRLRDLRLPLHPHQLHVQKDGSCFVTAKTDKELCVPSTQKKILLKLGVVVFKALDFNLSSTEDCHISHELEELIDFMTSEDNDDEGIERDSEEAEEDLATVDGDDCGLRTSLDVVSVSANGCGGERKHLETKELDHVLEYCSARVSPSKSEDHYRAVCRALVTETLELRTFLQRVSQGELRLKVDVETTGKELEKIHFSDWARFWMQVVDELRRGVRLKKINFSRTPIEYELTPYEILMEDIRSRKYNLRKVMVNGDIPPRVKKDAHAVILEFIRSRPPLRKASERKLAPAPLKRVFCPREQLLDSIRKGRVLKPVHPKLKSRLLPTTTQLDSVQKSCDDDIDSSSSGAHSLDGVSSTDGEGGSCGGPSFIHQHPTSTSNKTMTLGRPTFSHTGGSSSAPRNTLRLIPVDFSLFNDDDLNDEPVNDGADSSTCSGQQRMQQNGGHRISSGGGGLVVAGVAGGKRSSTDDRTADSTNRLMIVNNENNQNNINTVLRRTTYDLATQCESRRASLRRHTIIGCNQSYKRDPLASHSMPPSRPASRTEQHPPVRSEATPASTTLPAPTTNAPTKEKPSAMVTPHTINGARPAPIGGGSGGGSGGEYGTVGSGSNLSSLDTWTKNSLDEHQWKDTFNLNDRLSLTLEEIVHIRSVMTKAELEGLPVDVHIKEDVEKRKVCFLCLRTRFTLFARGILCKLCQRTVCNKCNTKMRIPTEHFRNVPVVLLSPSLMNSPCTSNTPSPSHHAHGTGSGPTSMVDESFPRSLMERLLRPELDRKTRNTVGSAPSSPKNQRSASSTPGTSLHGTETLSLSLSHHVASANAAKDTVAVANGAVVASSVSAAQRCSLMSRSMEGPNSLPPQSPARPHSNCSTLDRKNRFAKAFTLTTAGGQGGGALDPQKERLTGELMAVCNDCRSLVLEIIRSSRQTRTTARNQVLRHLTLDISPVYK
ncbi:protein spire isoform X3 [Anopheles coustani]|uniref:protein spire isoform X3 n=1 Tax=Anopheles coustani TaxID=139045 RepID=UPI0026592CA8|nr:protein spire isoform X3 [Anopheles coustani]